MRHLPPVAAMLLAPSAHADMLLRLSDSVIVWNGGIAVNNGNGWYGQGWDRFPGVNPPWNPVTQPVPEPQPVAPVVIVEPEPMPAPCRPVPAARNLTLNADGVAIPVQIRW